MRGPSWLFLAALIGPIACDAADNAPTASLPEFRGYYTMGGRAFFSVYDPSRQRGFWLGENEADAGFRVRGFDTTTLILSVDYENRELALPLKRGKVAMYSPTATGSDATPANATNTTAAIPVEAQQSPAESEAMRRIIAEKRKLRLQAGQTQPAKAVR